MYRPVYRRVPTQVVAMILAAPKAHAPGRQDCVRQAAVVHLDQVDAVAQSTPKRALADRPVVRRAQPQAVVGDAEAVEPDVVSAVGQGPGLEAHHGIKLPAWPS